MEERDELEIETRLRAALQARSELVTHSTLRPGIPPNEHTAGARARRESWWSWRRMWVPVTVAAALAGGVFVGAQLPSGSDKGTVSAGSGGTGPGPAVTVPSASPTPDASGGSAGTAATVSTIGFTLADGWQVTQISDTAGCVTPKTRPAPKAGGSVSDALPCGVDALYLETGVPTTAWPLSTAAKNTGWWPTAVDSASDIPCPTAPAASSGGNGGDGSNGSSSGDAVKTSVLLRSSEKYALAGQTTAEYREWAVTCGSGSGVQPMLWKLNAAAGSPVPTAFSVATLVSADPQYDSALLGMVGTLHPAS